MPRTYRGFDDVPRYREAEAMKTGLIPALVDHRLATDDEWAAYHHFLAAEIRKLDPGARVGAESSDAGDMERMLGGVQMWARDAILCRSLAPPGLLTSTWWGGYGDGAKDATPLWEGLIGGYVNFQQFFHAFGVEGSLNPDFSYRAFMEKVLPELQEIYAGPAVLLRGAEVVSDDAVAIHYSRVSQHASVALTQLGTPSGSSSTLIQALGELGHDYRYVSPHQIANGKLRAPLARVLFLPASYAISQTEANGIDQWVRAGGTVVADLLPGVLNEFARRLPSGRLDAVFGATCNGQTVPTAITDLSVDVEMIDQAVQLHCPRTMAEASLNADGAEVVARAGGMPLLLLHRYGKGKTILLNFDLSRVSRPLRTHFISALLQGSAVDPRYRLEGPSGARLYALRRGALDLVGVILPADNDRPARLFLAKPAVVYDVRSGRGLGHVREIELPPSAAGQRVHLFALQAEPVAGLTLTGPDDVVSGATLQLAVRMNAGSVDPAGRVVRVDVMDPEGRPVRHYRDFITLAGPAAEIAVPLAFNDTPGRWTVRATDVASGVVAEKVGVHRVSPQTPLPLRGEAG